MSHVNLDMLDVEINKSHFDIVMLHVDITYLGCQGHVKDRSMLTHQLDVYKTQAECTMGHN